MRKLVADSVDWIGRIFVAHQAMTALVGATSVSSLILFGLWLTPIASRYWPIAAVILSIFLICILWLCAWDWSQKVISEEKAKLHATGRIAYDLSMAIQSSLNAGGSRFHAEEVALFSNIMAIRHRILKTGCDVPVFPDNADKRVVAQKMAVYFAIVGMLMINGLHDEAKREAKAFTENG